MRSHSPTGSQSEKAIAFNRKAAGECDRFQQEGGGGMRSHSPTGSQSEKAIALFHKKAAGECDRTLQQKGGGGMRSHSPTEKSPVKRRSLSPTEKAIASQTAQGFTLETRHQ
nr:hypothetical protein [Arthrospira sp. PLM2.Bin9]